MILLDIPEGSVAKREDVAEGERQSRARAAALRGYVDELLCRFPELDATVLSGRMSGNINAEGVYLFDYLQAIVEVGLIGRDEANQQLSHLSKDLNLSVMPMVHGPSLHFDVTKLVRHTGRAVGPLQH